MKTTANLGLKKPEGTDVVNIDDINYNTDIIDTELSKRALKADIPTVSVQSVNGKTGTVTLIAADVGAAKQDDFASHKAENTRQIGDINDTALDVTLKGKSLVEMAKVLFQSANNSLQQVNSGKDGIYNAVVGKGVTPGSKDFLGLTTAINKISRGQGNAVEPQVLGGVAFSNADGILRTGNMPNRTFSANNNCYINAVSARGDYGGSLCVVPQTGYYKEEVNSSNFGPILLWDGNFKAENIVSGKSIFGVLGNVVVTPFASGIATSNSGVNPVSISVSGLSFQPKIILIEMPYSGGAIKVYNSNLKYQVESHTFYWEGDIKGTYFSTSWNVWNNGFSAELVGTGTINAYWYAIG